MARDVFVSYRKEDQATAVAVCDALEQRGIACWIAPRDIPPGEEWPVAIVAGIKRCHTLLLVLSSHSHSSKQIAREVETADRAGANIITFRIEDVTPPPSLEYFLQNIQWIDAFDNRYADAVETLARTIRASKSFPAEKTVVLNPAEIAAGVAATAGAAAAPAPAPPRRPAPPPASAATPPAKKTPVLVAAIGVGILAVGGIGYFAMNRNTGTANNPTAPVQQPTGVVPPTNPASDTSTSPSALPGNSPAAPAAPSDKDQLEAIDLANNGIALVGEGKYQNALEALTKATNLDPRQHLAYLWRARAYMFLKLQDKALADVNQALEIRPGWDLAFLTRGQINNRMQNFPAAEADLSKVIENASALLRQKNFKWVVREAYDARALARRHQHNDAGADADHAEWQRLTGGE